MAARKEMFEKDIEQTKKLEAEKSKTRYEWQLRDYTEMVNGKELTSRERVLVKTKKSLNDRVLDASERHASKLQTCFNKLSQNVRRLSGRPRKTGSNYADSKPADELLTSAKLLPVDCAWSAQAVTKGGAASGAALSPGNVSGGLSAVAEAGSFAAVPLAVSDGMAAVKGVVAAKSQRSKDQQNVFQYRSNACRFGEKIEPGKISEITALEPDHFMDFELSAKKLFHPTREESSTKKVQESQLGRLAVVQPISAGIATGAAIASHVVASVAPATVALSAVGAISAGIEVGEGIHEGLRSVHRHARAKQRKEAMERILDAAKGNTSTQEHQLLQGVVASLSAHQDRVRRQAKREEKYAAFHATKAGASIGPCMVLAAATGAVSAGVLAAATLGGVVPIAVLPGVAWAVGISVRNHERLEHARRYKWDQRAMRVASFDMDRQQLEKKLIDGTPVEVEIGQGEYLHDEERFAGTRKMKFTRDTNPYMGPDWLAFNVLDMVRKGIYDPNAEWVKLLQIYDIDAVYLFAICKAASFKPEAKQLDYIQRRLAEKMELPLPLDAETGEQVLPAPSFFIKKYNDAKNKIPDKFRQIKDPEEIEKKTKEADEIEQRVKKAIRAEIRAGLWKEVPKFLWKEFSDDISAERQKLIYAKILPHDKQEIERKTEERVFGEVWRETAEEIRKELKKSFPDDGEAGMDAFDAAIGDFLKKIKGPGTPLIKALKLVVRTPKSELEWLNDELKALDALEIKKPAAPKVEEVLFEKAFEKTQRLAELNKPLQTLQKNIRMDELLTQIEVGRFPAPGLR